MSGASAGTASSSAARRVAAVAAVGLLHAGPAATWLPPIRRLTPGLSGLGRTGHLALTFDDGPDAAGTPAVLAALQRLRWRATFFLLGSQVQARPDLAAEIAAAGHEIGLHGFDHRYLLARTPASTYRDIARGLDAVQAATGRRPGWFRPPYGVLTGSCLLTLRRLDLRPVLWTAWGQDWRADATAQSVVDELSRGRLDGGTVLLHDSDVTSAPGSWQVTTRALPLLAEQTALRGLTVGTLAEHGLAVRSAARAG